MKQAALFLEAFYNSKILYTGIMFVLVCAILKIYLFLSARALHEGAVNGRRKHRAGRNEINCIYQ